MKIWDRLNFLASLSAYPSGPQPQISPQKWLIKAQSSFQNNVAIWTSGFYCAPLQNDYFCCKLFSTCHKNLSLSYVQATKASFNLKWGLERERPMVVKWGETKRRSSPLDNIQHTLSLPCFLSSLTHAHSPSRADSVMCIPETPLPHHFPQGRERVEERMLSWLYKAERTPNEYIYKPIKIMHCSCGRLAFFQGVLAQPDRESGEDTSATFEIW